MTNAAIYLFGNQYLLPKKSIFLHSFLAKMLFNVQPTLPSKNKIVVLNMIVLSVDIKSWDIQNLLIVSQILNCHSKLKLSLKN
jgi:hypothetical protein